MARTVIIHDAVEERLASLSDFDFYVYSLWKKGLNNIQVHLPGSKLHTLRGLGSRDVLLRATKEAS